LTGKGSKLLFGVKAPERKADCSGIKKRKTPLGEQAGRAKTIKAGKVRRVGGPFLLPEGHRGGEGAKSSGIISGGTKLGTEKGGGTILRAEGHLQPTRGF